MSIFAVHYTYDPTQSEARLAIRGKHREWLTGLAEQETCLAAGAYQDKEGALLIFQAGERADVEEILAGDPYLHSGVISATEIDLWPAVIGQFSHYLNP